MLQGLRHAKASVKQSATVTASVRDLEAVSEEPLDEVPEVGLVVLGRDQIDRINEPHTGGEPALLTKDTEVSGRSSALEPSGLSKNDVHAVSTTNLAFNNSVLISHLDVPVELRSSHERRLGNRWEKNEASILWDSCFIIISVRSLIKHLRCHSEVLSDI